MSPTFLLISPIKFDNKNYKNFKNIVNIFDFYLYTLCFADDYTENTEDKINMLRKLKEKENMQMEGLAKFKYLRFTLRERQNNSRRNKR